MAKRLRTWIVVADGARARFLAPSDDRSKLVPARNADMVALESRGHAHDLKSDKPGRSYSSARGGVRHALEPPHDPHKLEKHRFSASLVEALEVACERREFDRLVVVAPRRSLGEMRTLMSSRLQRCIQHEIAKDLTNETSARLWKRLMALGTLPL
ncbi:MAG: host attachment protein, partial [Reyranella sp.]|uniref:host attachment protein n=1 Tax=Reyranella sp. TaxID=1929291 RepID=UPI0027310F19|nr:host attachment protein [Reyranella sp.]MDP1964452.1 host attachment protein [Reyranella sp.]MDP2374244.1 host attachment protein [Reyranella sp.]